MKALANDARRESVNTPRFEYSPTARQTYAPQVSSLRSKANTALKNKPLERQAQLLANTVYQQKTRSNPEMDPTQKKKVKSQALDEARSRVGAKKQAVKITPSEWEAIQSGAVSDNFLRTILDNADLDEVKKLATPRAEQAIPPAKMARMRTMLASGYTQAEIADALGVPTSTLNDAIREG